MGQFKRKKKLIKPGLQFRLISVFLLTASAAVLTQFILLNRVLVMLAKKMPEQAETLTAAWPSMLGTTLLLTLGLLVPFTLGVGILTTFRIAGPIHRFETYMRQVSRGEDRGPCMLRKGDMLQGLCNEMNTMVTTLREGQMDEPVHTDVDDVASLTTQQADESEESPVLGENTAG